MTETAVDLQQLARDHLWMHFTRMGGLPRQRACRSSSAATGATSRTRTASATSTRSPACSRSTSATAYGEEIGQAALEQMRELPFYTNWSYAHPRAIELAAEIASLAPGDLNRVFFVSGGSEAVESAWKLARQYYLARGEKRPPRARRLGARAGPRCDRREPAARPAPLQGDHPPDGLPRDDARRALDDRDPGDPDAVRAARSRGAERAQHEPLPEARRGDRGGVHAPCCSTSSSRRSWRWARRRCASSTWSPCRTRVAPSRRPSATGAGCARSATSTTSSSPPTR